MKILISRNKREGWYCGNRNPYIIKVRTKLKLLTLKHRGSTTEEDYEAFYTYFC